jgi:hypothetical protein
VVALLAPSQRRIERFKTASYGRARYRYRLRLLQQSHALWVALLAQECYQGVRIVHLTAPSV